MKEKTRISDADSAFLQSPNKEVEKLCDANANHYGETLGIRDYAMASETGFITAIEQKHMLMLTAATQCDRNNLLHPLKFTTNGGRHWVVSLRFFQTFFFLTVLSEGKTEIL